MRFGSGRATPTLSCRRATGADVPLLRDLYADAHVELAVLPADCRFVLVDTQFRAQRRQRGRQFPGAEQQILERDGAAVGQLVLDRRADHVQVLDIGVGLGRRREGIASAALRTVCASADVVRVELWSGNAAARALCESVGFRAVGERLGVVTYEHVRT